MPQIKIVKRIPDKETLQIYVDGNQVFEDEFQCENEFSLAVNQYIEPRDPKSVKTNLKDMLMILILGGKKVGGEEVLPPWQAVWEGDCIAEQNGVLNIYLYMYNGHPSIEVQSYNIEILETKSEEVVREMDKRVWVGNVLPYVIPFALFFVMINAVCIATMDEESRLPLALFMTYVWIMFGIAFYKMYRMYKDNNTKTSPEERTKKMNKRMHIAIIFMKISVTVSIIGAITQIVGGLIIKTPWVGITSFIIAVVFILSMAISSAFFEKEEADYYVGSSNEYSATAIKRWNRYAWTFALIGIGCVVFVAA